jgi:single-stranded-DNA-specific exonuclease
VPITNHEKQWQLRPRYQEIQQLLTNQLGISPLLCQLLASRNITTPEAAEIFLSPTLSNLHSPFLMKDMEKAVQRICGALRDRELILLYGDYDVDGITGTSLLFLFLKELGANVSYFIPDRREEGYGLHKNSLQQLKEQGTQLIITIDCGISDTEQVLFARQEGIDVIITDHHEVPDVLPAAYAIVNPKQNNCTFPFDSLAGVGVVFKLIMALRKTLRDEGFFTGRSVPNLREYLDLVALGTIADIVPLIDENRILVKYGLQELTQGKRIGIKALKDVCGLTTASITSHLVAFRLAPRINAPGRLSQATRSVELLTTDDYEKAREIALLLEDENKQRQQMESRIVREACSLVEAEHRWEERKSIVLGAPLWHSGVIGICASRLLDKYLKPSILIACDKEKGIGKGSARSPESFHLYEGLKACSHLLLSFGGHHSAAGLTIGLEDVEAFRVLFEKVVSERIADERYVPSIAIDAEVSLCDISETLVQEISRLEPFGLCNPEPTFSSLAFDSYTSQMVGKGHLKLKITENSQCYDAIGFNLAERFFSLLQEDLDVSPQEKKRVRIAFIPQINDWQGRRSVQLKIKDIKRV